MNLEKVNLEKVNWLNLIVNKDARGNLIAIEESLTIPFQIKRVFYMNNVSQDRGGHAHIDTDQVIIAVHGTFKVKLSNDKNNKIFVFKNSEKGLFVPKLTFTELYDFSPNAVCLVLASTTYDIKKSLRNREDYLFYLKTNKS